MTLTLSPDTVLFSFTIPGWLLALIVSALWLAATFLAFRWFDRRYLDPWLRRRVGLPPKAEDEGRMADEGEETCGAKTRVEGVHNTFECDLIPHGSDQEHRDYHLLHAWPS